jgi:hypothetical protein
MLQEQETDKVSHNNHMHSDSKKRCGFRYASAAPLFAAGDVRRYVKEE